MSETKVIIKTCLELLGYLLCKDLIESIATIKIEKYLGVVAFEHLNWYLYIWDHIFVSFTVSFKASF